MQNSILIRTATLADVTAVTAVYLASRKELLAFAPLAHTDASVHAWLRDILIPTGNVLVAEENSVIIGMMALSKHENIGWIDQLYLLPTAIRQGLGTLLLSKAKATLGSPIRLHTFQKNEMAKRFYERQGFQIIALSDGSTNEERCPDILYEWRLSETA